MKENHYVDNKKFFGEMCDWKEKVKEAEDSGEPRPPVSDYIGECFLKIAERLSRRPNFINYTYRDEMISDGIENCLQYAHNFNPDKSKNPFAYFTQIIYYAFLRRITKEKKQHIDDWSDAFEILKSHIKNGDIILFDEISYSKNRIDASIRFKLNTHK